MGLLLGNAPIPLSDELVGQDRYVTSAWVDWLSQVTQVVSQGPTRLNFTSVTAQGASIGATDFSGGGISGGFYRLSYYAQITRAATVSSSLTVSILWDNGGVTQTFTGAAITGNTTATYQTGTLMVALSGPPINYSTLYASVGGTTMQYSLGVFLEAMAG